MTRRLALGGKMRTEWERLGTVESDSEPGVEHVISKRGDQVGCDCMAYRFKKGEKTCKHVEAFNGAKPVVQQYELVRGQRSAARGEKFTVRRAFDFGNQ